MVLKVGGIAPLAAILRDMGAKKTEGVIGGKTHKVGENAQPLIDFLTSGANYYDLLVSCKF